MGLDLALPHRPDLVLLDPHLPDMNGFEVMRTLRECELDYAPPVAAVSGAAMPRDINRALNSGFERYLTKPLDVREFPEIVARFLPESN